MHSIRHGHTLFDFTISDEPYMRDWCKGRETLYDHLSARTQVGALTVAIRGAAMRMKRTIKETPVLWNAFYNARAAVGCVLRRKDKV